MSKELGNFGNRLDRSDFVVHDRNQPCINSHGCDNCMRIDAVATIHWHYGQIPAHLSQVLRRLHDHQVFASTDGKMPLGGASALATPNQVRRLLASIISGAMGVAAL